MTNTYFTTKNTTDCEATLYQAKMISIIHQIPTYVIMTSDYKYQILTESECDIHTMCVVGTYNNGTYTNGLTLLQNALAA